MRRPRLGNGKPSLEIDRRAERTGDDPAGGAGR